MTGLLLSACADPRPAPPTGEAVYVWQTAWTPDVRAALAMVPGVEPVVLRAEVGDRVREVDVPDIGPHGVVVRVDRFAPQSLERAADLGWVLQVHAPPAHDGDPVLGRDAEESIAAASALGVPFRVALPTYGVGEVLDAAGGGRGVVVEGATRRGSPSTPSRGCSPRRESYAEPRKAHRHP